MATMRPLARKPFTHGAPILVVLLGVLCGCGLASHETAAAPKVTCWNGSGGDDGHCPPLEGEAALQWVFPQSSGKPECKKAKPFTSKLAAAQVETYECSFPNTDAVAYLMRWKSVGDAVSAIGDHATPWVHQGVTYGTKSTGAGGCADSGAGFHCENYDAIFAYADSPFGLQVVSPDSWPDSAELPPALNGLLDFRDPTAVRDGGTRA